jgi:hypothetical protein
VAELVSVRAQGSISTSVQDSTVAQDCACAAPSPSASFNFSLQASAAWGDVEASSRRTILTSPSAFVTLPLPSVGAGFVYQGRVFYFRSHERDQAWLVRITFSEQDDQVVACGGVLLIEAPETDFIETVEISGSGSFEWLSTGQVAEA